MAERPVDAGVPRSSTDSSLRFFGSGFLIPAEAFEVEFFGAGRFFEGTFGATSNEPGADCRAGTGDVARLDSSSSDVGKSVTGAFVVSRTRVPYSFWAAAMAFIVALSDDGSVLRTVVCALEVAPGSILMGISTFASGFGELAPSN